MNGQPLTWKTEAAIAWAALALAVIALYAVYLHKPA
jgi:hypothetical protein